MKVDLGRAEPVLAVTSSNNIDLPVHHLKGKSEATFGKSEATFIQMFQDLTSQVCEDLGVDMLASCLHRLPPSSPSCKHSTCRHFEFPIKEAPPTVSSRFS